MPTPAKLTPSQPICEMCGSTATAHWNCYTCDVTGKRTPVFFFDGMCDVCYEPNAEIMELANDLFGSRCPACAKKEDNYEPTDAQLWAFFHGSIDSDSPSYTDAMKDAGRMR